MTTSEKKEGVTYTFTTPVRAGFLNVITARAFKSQGKEKGEPRFDASFILAADNPDLVALKAKAGDLLKAAHPGKKLVMRRLTQDELDSGSAVEVSVPWKDGTKEADKAKGKGKDQEFFRGHIVLKAASKFDPALSAIEGGKVVTYDNPETRASLKRLFYAGAYFVPYLELNAYDARDDKPAGVNLRLKAVLFIKHGERIGGGVNAAEVFKGYAGTASAVDPGSNAADDDEIPF